MIFILPNKLLPNYLVIGDTGTTKIIEEQERRSQSETQTLSPSTLNLARPHQERTQWNLRRQTCMKRLRARLSSPATLHQG